MVAKAIEAIAPYNLSPPMSWEGPECRGILGIVKKNFAKVVQNTLKMC
jgi:hypothetical protein